MDDFIQKEILEKQLQEDFEQLLQIVLNYCCLNESAEITIRSKQELNSELLRAKLTLEKFLEGSLPKPKNQSKMCDLKKDSFYIHIHKTGQHVCEIRISGHYPKERIGHDIVKIKKYQYNYLYIDYSKYVDKQDYKNDIKLIIQGAKPQQVDYVCLSNMSNSSVSIMVNIIMNEIFKYLLVNTLIKTSKDKLQITWTAGD
jgi:hypothetical protein